MDKHKVLSTDEDIEKALAESAAAPEEPFVSAVSLENLGGYMTIMLKMSDGSVHGIPKSKLEGLANVADEVASNVEITEDGFGVRWPDLDLDMYVPPLLQGIYGTKTWMSSLGRHGGRVRSEAKGRAARENGLKGGRPHKSPTSDGLTTHNSDLEMIATASRRHSTIKQSRRLDFRFGYLLRSKADFARLFELDEGTRPRALPRVA